MRRLLTIALTLLTAGATYPQSGMTAVTGTIACYANGSVQASWINGNPTSPVFPNLNGFPFVQNVPSNMDSTGTFTMNLADVNQVQPQPSQWKITACAKGGSQPFCSTQLLTITGTSQNVSSAFTAAVCPGGTTITLTKDVIAGPGSGSLVATVVGLQSVAIANTTPIQNAVPNYNPATNRYEIAPLTLDQILPAFNISSFACSTTGTYEIGFTVASPTNCTANYTSLPTSAHIFDGTNTLNLTTPFTSGILAHSYTSATTATTTFTLTAIAATTKTATQSINWAPRNFGGTGTGGSATSSTASGNNAVLVGATGTLTSSYLGTSCTGQSYNATTSGTQFVYILLSCNVSNPTGGSFTTPGPTVFTMNTPTTITFANQFGASVTMYLYRSTNSFFTGSNYIITVGN